MKISKQDVNARLTDIADEADHIMGYGPTMDLATSEKLERKGQMNEPNAQGKLMEISEEMEILLSELDPADEDYALFQSSLESIRARLHQLCESEQKSAARREANRGFVDSVGLKISA